MSKTWKEVWAQSEGPKSTKDALILSSKGFVMGIADLIPGVSGGTIAFISGIYGQLLAAISSLSGNAIKNIVTFNLKEGFGSIHLRFIFFLAAGILSAMVSMSRVMHYLLNHQPVLTWSVFFGLIAASIYILGNEIENFKHPKNLAFVALGTIIGYVIVSLIPVTTPSEWWFIFLCGVIGITAMILPGISGSFLLLILGKYEYVTGALKNPTNVDNITILLIFACGCATGLLGFSRVLNYFLKNFHNATMAFLTGIMIGTMKKVWPWKEVLESKIVRGKVRVLRDQNIFPTTFDTEVILAFVLMVVGMVSILVLHNVAEKKRNNVSA